MIKHRIIWSVILFLSMSWIYTSIALLTTGQNTWALCFSIIIPLAIIFLVLKLQYIAISRKSIDTLAGLTDDIDLHRIRDTEMFDETKAPKELLPLVQALNRLVKFHQDRYQNERDFTANASHELRTPLAGIRLQTEVAIRTRDPKQKDTALNNILKAVDRGTRLVEQLLAISRLSYESVEFGKQPFELESVVYKNIDELKELSDKKGINIQIVNEEDHTITANKESISILVNNLLRNAIMYSPQGSTIRVCIEEAGNDINMKVMDEGPGILMEERQHVLQRFRKGSSGSKAGTGLGLAIVKKITDLHRGDVSLHHGDSGKGLTVEIVLPKIAED